MEGSKYGPIFLIVVIFGSVMLFFGPGGVIGGSQLLHYGMKGLLVEQQIAKQELEFRRELSLRELVERHRAAEHERQMQILRLQRPATTDENYEPKSQDCC